MKLLLVAGARPNFPKIAPILRQASLRPEVTTILVHTGQHYSAELSDSFFQDLGIREADVNLGVGSGTQAEQTAEVLRRIEPVLMREKPDFVLVVGDVNSTLAAALAATKLGLRVIHVESGLRSFDRSMPEEINRVLTDAIADYHFVTEQSGVENLIREGRSPDSIFLVGNVMIDSLVACLPRAEHSTIGHELGLLDEERWKAYAVLTLHRPSNVDAPEQLFALLCSIDSAADIPVIFPVHPRTTARMGAPAEGAFRNVRLVSPLRYLDFVSLLKHARLVLTDSGGIQEETTFLGVQCLTLRNNTERPATVVSGTNTLVGTDPAQIARAVRAALQQPPPPPRVPPLWDGQAAQRIVDTVVSLVAPSRLTAWDRETSLAVSPSFASESAHGLQKQAAR